MHTLTSIGNKLRHLSQRLAVSMGQSHHVRVWADCRHCGTKTRQVARSVDGYYRCLQCDGDPNAAAAAPDAPAAQ